MSSRTDKGKQNKNEKRERGKKTKEKHELQMRIQISHWRDWNAKLIIPYRQKKSKKNCRKEKHTKKNKQTTWEEKQATKWTKLWNNNEARTRTHKNSRHLPHPLTYTLYITQTHTQQIIIETRTKRVARGNLRAFMCVILMSRRQAGSKMKCNWANTEKQTKQRKKQCSGRNVWIKTSGLVKH